MHKKVIQIVYILLFLFSCKITICATYTTTGTPGTWDLGGTPSASDDIVINHDWSSHNGVQLANYSGTMTVNSGGHFKMFGSFSIFTGTIDIKAGGTFQVVGGTNVFAGSTINVNGSWEVSGNFTNNATASWTGTGTVTAGGDFNDNSGTSTTGETTCNGCTVTLPVELLMFEVDSLRNKAIIKWRTGLEINNDYFILEHSIDGISFESIGRVYGQGNSLVQNDYSFIHMRPNPNKVNYYRLRQVDFDESEEVFEIKTLHFIKQPKLELYQYGTSELFNLSGVNREFPVSIEVFSLDGKIIEHFELMNESTFRLSPKCMVLIRVVNHNQVLKRKFFIR